MDDLLTQKESEVFVCLLKFGPTRVSQIAKDTNLNRTALYHTLKVLIEKGLVFEIKKSNTTLFQSLSREDFKVFLSKRIKNVEVGGKRILDFFEEKKTPILHSGIKYFEGFEAVKKLYGDSWRENNEKQILAITDYKKAYETMGNFFDEEYFPFRVQAGVHVKSLLSMDAYGRRDKKRQEELLREMRFFNVFKELGIELNIFDDKISLVAFDKKKPMGVLLQNKLISDAFRRIFEVLWSMGKK